MKPLQFVLALLACLTTGRLLAQTEIAVPFEADKKERNRQDIQSLARRLDLLEEENRRLREGLLLEGAITSRQGSGGTTPLVSGADTELVAQIAHCDGDEPAGCPSCECDSAQHVCTPPSAPCMDCPRISTLSPYFKLHVFGSLNGEFVFAEARPVIPSGIILISPDLGQDTETFEAHAKSSSIGVALTGPKIGSFQSGGTFLSYLYGETFQADNYGAYVVRAFGELKNQAVRFAIGLNGDVINPRSPASLNFNAANGAGNLGFFRGQLLMENEFQFSKAAQLTTQFALSDPVATSFANFDQVSPGSINLLEDNGMPNFEGRAMVGYGASPQPGQPRPFEFAVSGLAGQLRRTDLPSNHIHDVWAYGLDAHLGLTKFVGFNGEFFSGQAIGNYNASIIQVDNGNFDPVRSTGGWGEAYLNWSHCLRSNVGYAIDDPLNSTLTIGLPTRNEVAFANLIWSVNPSLEIGFEISRWETTYTGPVPDNDAMVYHSRVRLKF